MTENESSTTENKEESVFGNKITYWGTVFFILLILLAVYRHITMGVPFGGEGEEGRIETVQPKNTNQNN